jgi:hypothetical protein
LVGGAGEFGAARYYFEMPEILVAHTFVPFI